MDNNEVYSLFEDIKNGLKGISSKLENTPKVANNSSGGQPSTVDLAPHKGAVRQFRKGASGTDKSHADQIR